MASALVVPDVTTDLPEDSSSNATASATASSTEDGERKARSETSQSSTEPHSDCLGKALNQDAVDFLLDLSNYLALGCLACERPSVCADTESGWQDVTQDASAFFFDRTTSANLYNLATGGWIRIQRGRSILQPKLFVYRIYLLPGDVGLRFVDRQNRKLLAALENMLAKIDTSPDTWEGRYAPGREISFDQWATADAESLFYMFNKLPSPSPDVSIISDHYVKGAMQDMLNPEIALPGLKTPLYPYQRRSAGLMLQRESIARLELDPRLELRTAPDGSTFYFGARELQFVRNPRFYEACRGGILAESMGYGKTLMCLALILATKHHLPKVPAAYAMPPIRPRTAKLTDMAISAANRKSVPWRVEFERIRHATGEQHPSCVMKLAASPPKYEIPLEPMRWNRKTVVPPPEQRTMAATTIIVVPRNLCKQWHSEIKKHVEEDFLRILVMENLREPLPSADELRSYDVVLFSRNRFENEIRDGADVHGRRLLATPPACRCPYIGATRNRDCNCVKADDLYESPLRHLHFKRLIIDEGHFFSSRDSTATTVANRLVKADHRWVVSGTPAKDLLGIEVDMSIAENFWQTPKTRELRDTVLDRRRQFDAREDTAGAIKSLGSLASSFLRIKPWSSFDSNDRPALWDDYVYRHEANRRKTYSGFSTCLRRTLETMVVKTQANDVEKDIELPPLSHKVVRLEPSFYDKLTANLFTLVLTANAVTSERTDADYLFHKNSAGARHQLINNLRQSAFFWTGFSEDDVLASKKTSSAYLEKEGIGASLADRSLLKEALAAADSVLASAGWRALSQSHELGLFMQDWPTDTEQFWAFSECRSPMLTGVSQLLEAQKHVNQRIGTEEPGEGLAGVGIKALARARKGREQDEGPKNAPKNDVTKSGIPASTINGEPVLKRRPLLPGRAQKQSPKARKKSLKGSFRVSKRESPAKALSPVIKIEDDDEEAAIKQLAVPYSGVENSLMREAELPLDSAFARTRMIGTTSAKLSYLLNEIHKYHETEKILVFYDGENAAYYLSQCLELLGIRHEIYAKSLGAELKASYVVRFDQEVEDRVLLMDVKQAAHGLNITSASRVYFVNPVCRPNIEAQAVKRAHRIGQQRKVYVETLILKGTIEEKMHERASRMTGLEHRDVSHLEDDGGMREIIQSAAIIPVAAEEAVGHGQIARLEVPQRLWGRPGWRESLLHRTSQAGGKRRRAETPSEDGGIDSDGAALPKRQKASSKSQTKMRRVVSVEIPLTPNAADSVQRAQQTDESSEDDEPMMQRWRRQSFSQSGSHGHATGSTLVDTVQTSAAHPGASISVETTASASMPNSFQASVAPTSIFGGLASDSLAATGSGQIGDGMRPPHRLSVPQLLND